MTGRIAGCLAWIIIIPIAISYFNYSQRPSPVVSATATAEAPTVAAKLNATATARTCEYRQTRAWCAGRRNWATASEDKLSALLKLAGGLNALTSREQERVHEIEQQLAQYRRICEASGVEANLSAVLEEVVLTMQEWGTTGEIERELARYRSTCES